VVSRLSPEQHAAFRPHEVTDEPYERIAEIIVTSELHRRAKVAPTR
jgi:hypothetical protein